MSADKTLPPLFRHPILLLTLVLVGVTIIALSVGIPIGRTTQVAIYVLYGMGVNLLVAYTGLVPFGASVFFGTSTYVVAIGLLRGLDNELFALVAGVVFAALLGAILGAVILRRRGLYFALLTLACSQIAFEIAFKWTSFTGGENGLQNVPLPVIINKEALHAFTLVTVIATAWGLWRFVHSPFGRALQAVRDNEQRALSLGYDTYRLKLGSFIVAGSVIGYAGGLLSLLLQGAYANNLNWEHAGDALLMAVLGGVHHFLGPLWGAIVFILLEDTLSGLIENWWLIFAPIVIAFTLLSREGIHGLLQRAFGRSQWTLVRKSVPARPATIAPYQASRVAPDALQPLLTIRGLSKHFGSLVTADNIDLDVHSCKLHAFIGPNGAGKTTFFNMLSGMLAPSRGKIVFEGRDITRMAVRHRARLGIRRSFQIVSVFDQLSVFENVRVAVQAARPGRLGWWRDAHGMEDVNARSWTLLNAVGLTERAADDCTELSHGERRLLELAITLAADAKLLLLDEPLAGLAEVDRARVAALIRKLADEHAVVLIEHDIDRVLAISDRITVLHHGKLIADGTPKEVAAAPEVIEAYLGAAKLEQSTSTDMGPRAADTASAEVLLELDNVCAGYGGSRVLDGLSLNLRRGEVLAILGRNGVGKTTAMAAMMGTVPVTSGRILFENRQINGLKPYQINRLGLSIVPEGRRLFSNLTVLENLRLAERPGGITIDEVYELFPRLATRRNARAESLSGGERQMVAIARALMVPSKVILLDEPFEGLAPAVVKEVVEAVQRLRGRASLIIVEHSTESVLAIADRAYVIVNGQAAYEGSATALAADDEAQARLLGIVGAPTAPVAT